MTNVSRRRFLATSLVGVTSIGLFGSTSAEAAKATKQQAHYRDSPHGPQQCSKCRYFLQPDSCKLVAGTISPHGWCKFFLPSG